MSLKYYGIYTAYGPRVDLRGEGLGRYLAAFLKGAEGHKNVRFIVACPSWSKENLIKLCESEGVDINGFDIISPSGKPAILRIFEAFGSLLRARPSRQLDFFNRLVASLSSLVWRPVRWLAKKMTGSRNWLTTLSIVTVFLVLSVFLIPVVLIVLVCVFLFRLWRVVAFIQERSLRNSKEPAPHTSKAPALRTSKEPALLRTSKEPATRSSIIDRIYCTFKTIIRQFAVPVSIHGFSRIMYSLMEENETSLLLEQINSLKHVSAWYSPTVFWPEFNQIAMPRLMCVPDVVFTHFPIAFSNDRKTNHLMKNFKKIESAINGCENFVTYSQQVKWQTMVERYQTKPESVHLVRHAPSTLDQFVSIKGFPNAAETSKNFCKNLLHTAMQKASNPKYTSDFLNGSVRYLFYASQFRPNKNILNLLRAYEYLLRKRFIGHKLILTGNLNMVPDAKEFVSQHHLENEVLCLKRLSIIELAACYKLADVAVNPSLSEGGCPFTFTEALSVDTPVVMSNIPVTLEVLDDQNLADIMFFDPFSWQDIAERIEWAIHNREELLALQKPVYDVLSQRTWEDVVTEHIEILQGISSDFNQR